MFKTAGMMDEIVTYYDLAKKTIAESTGENKITWA